MSVESYLTRQLDLRFIDARVIAIEARHSLGIEGYPTRDQLGDLRAEAVRIFQAKSTDERRALQQMNMELESLKIPSGSSAVSLDGSDFDSMLSDELSRTSTESRKGIRNLFRR